MLHSIISFISITSYLVLPAISPIVRNEQDLTNFFVLQPHFKFFFCAALLMDSLDLDDMCKDP